MCLSESYKYEDKCPSCGSEEVECLLVEGQVFYFCNHCRSMYLQTGGRIIRLEDNFLILFTGGIHMTLQELINHRNCFLTNIRSGV